MGRAAAASLVSHEARADALEDALLAQSNAASLALTAAASAPAATAAAGSASIRYPAVAELAAGAPGLGGRWRIRTRRSS
jgi:hypothetical protein